ncbi:MAG: dihydrodipicolinate synthase family protein [Rhizobiaceae bacterium]|nr:dihydrodipicolinate synthase family protein [Rhizobiaceae bacterium]
MHEKLTGIVVPLATPFAAATGDFDEATFRRMIDLVVGSGVSAVIANAATSQFSSMSDDERTRVAEVAAEQVAGRVPLLIGAGASSTREAVRWTRHAKSLGAAGVMIMPPYYGPTPADVAVEHFAGVSDGCDLPIMIYNAPYASHVLLLPEHILQMAERANIGWVKLTTGVLDHVTGLRLSLDRRIGIYEGVDPLAFPSFCMGADGWVAGPGNMIPEIALELWRRVRAGETEAARRLHEKAYPLLMSMREKMAYGSVINEVCRLRGIDPGVVRLPGCELGAEHLARVHRAVDSLGLRGVAIGAFDASGL